VTFLTENTKNMHEVAENMHCALETRSWRMCLCSQIFFFF